MDQREKKIIRFTHKSPKSAAWLSKKLKIEHDRLEDYLHGDHARFFFYDKGENPHRSSVSLTIDGLHQWRGTVRNEFLYSLLYSPILIIVAIFYLKRSS